MVTNYIVHALLLHKCAGYDGRRSLVYSESNWNVGFYIIYTLYSMYELVFVAMQWDMLLDQYSRNSLISFLWSGITTKYGLTIWQNYLVEYQKSFTIFHVYMASHTRLFYIIISSTTYKLYRSWWLQTSSVTKTSQCNWTAILWRTNHSWPTL